MNRDSKKRTAVTPLRSRIRAATCDALMAAAESVFGEQGLHSAHMGDIAARAGVSVGTLYNHFEDREALLAALLEARRAELLRRLDQVLASPPPRRDFRALLERFLGELLDHLERHRPFFSILMEIEHARDKATWPAVAGGAKPAMVDLYQRVKELVRRGVEWRAIRPDEEELYPALFMGMVKGMAVRELYQQKPSRGATAAGGVDERVGQLARFFLEGAGA
jgi:AcrR family transcriptional regulator